MTNIPANKTQRENQQCANCWNCNRDDAGHNRHKTDIHKTDGHAFRLRHLLKVDPYLRPLYDALYQIMGADSFAKNMEKGLIEVAPLAYMRGRTLDNAFIILDEAQNTTPAQMKMFLTRIGFGSKVIITGDASQKDLPKDAASGLDVAMKVLKKIDDIGFCQLTSKDVVRHPLVQQIVQAYDDYEKKQKPAKSRKDDRYAVKNKEYRR